MSWLTVSGVKELDDHILQLTSTKTLSDMYVILNQLKGVEKYRQRVASALVSKLANEHKAKADLAEMIYLVSEVFASLIEDIPKSQWIVDPDLVARFDKIRKRWKGKL